MPTSGATDEDAHSGAICSIPVVGPVRYRSHGTNRSRAKRHKGVGHLVDFVRTAAGGQRAARPGLGPVLAAEACREPVELANYGNRWRKWQGK